MNPALKEVFKDAAAEGLSALGGVALYNGAEVSAIIQKVGEADGDFATFYNTEWRAIVTVEEVQNPGFGDVVEDESGSFTVRQVVSGNGFIWQLAVTPDASSESDT